jgi:TPR repeat protein
MMYDDDDFDDMQFEVEELVRRAEQGDAYSQWALGTLYFHGQIIPQDYAKAAEWSRKAAEQGLAEAQFHLGFLYYSGKGVLKDNTRAAEWFGKAAAQGDEKAKEYLYLLRGCKFYYDERDYDRAIAEFTAAIKLNPNKAMYYFYRGQSYMKKKDDAREIIDFTEAIRLGLEDNDIAFFVYYNCGVVYERRDLYSDAKANYEKANSLRPNDELCREALNTTIDVLNGRVGSYNFKKEQTAKEKLRMEIDEVMAERGDVKAQYELGLLYFNGKKGVPKDNAKAAEWFRKATEQGHTEAKDYLAKAEAERIAKVEADRKAAKAKKYMGWGALLGGLIAGVFFPVLHMINAEPKLYVFILDLISGKKGGFGTAIVGAIIDGLFAGIVGLIFLAFNLAPFVLSIVLGCVFGTFVGAWWVLFLMRRRHRAHQRSKHNGIKVGSGKDA